MIKRVGKCGRTAQCIPKRCENLFGAKIIGIRGQVWVETVIYTLIGLTIIGLVMAAALPKINAMKDEAIIEQSIAALGNIDEKIYEVQKAMGNRRVIDLEIKKGVLIVDMENDAISWILDSSFQYSENDTTVSMGHLNVTTRVGNPWEVELQREYSVDLQYNGRTTGVKQLDAAPTPYKFIVESNGTNVDGKIIIELNDA